ncbi:flavodoxin domain-containing protein [Poseidonocella sp. HB161398]|uniref:flavodoxin domain-containing protein n=1 Tax=Poseidonocella sp. HB161398 TaxID=2320855 RepID=UPI00110891CF|nr:flavodoxin domain-containing protein [Poseidonocella sp. HB161398]
MTKILFGTESGNSEMAADDIADVLRAAGHDAEIVPMEEADGSTLVGTGFAVIITSTYGEGELPETAQPFHDMLASERPDLSGLRFAAFGLGDSTYETYGNGIDILAALLKDLGATQVGETGRHDAARTEPLADTCTSWAEAVLPATAIAAE